MFFYYLKRVLFGFHIIGLPVGGFIILIGVIVLSSCIYRRKKDIIQPFYSYSPDTDNVNRIRYLWNANVFLTNSTPWIVLVSANICYIFPIVTFFTIAYICLNVLVILLLFPHDIKTNKDDNLPFNGGRRLFAFLCCMCQIYNTIKPLIKKAES